MKVPRPRFTLTTAAACAVALALAGWALAEGEVPFVSSSSDTSDTTTTTTPGSPGASTDNVAVASNTQDGRTVVALAIKIVQTDSSTVDAANAAVAAASCTDCQTVAVALEGVLVIGSPDNFSPTNLALAINSECTNCQTLAAAYQKVVQHDTRVRISGEGRREIAAIRTDLLSLRNSGLDIVTIRQRVNDAAARFVNVLETQVYPIGRPPDAAAASGATTTAPPTTTASTTPTTEPTTTTAAAP
jgi:putative peptide zinc metalloprotease protein